MIDKRYISTLKRSLHTHAKRRRDVIKTAGDGLHHAKRAIFEMHRGNMSQAAKKIDEAHAAFDTLYRRYRKRAPEMLTEGSYKAGLEEYVESVLFYQFLTEGKIGKVDDFDMPRDVYLAGLCDVPGELYRYAIKAATHRDMVVVAQCSEAAQEVVGALIEFDLTKYLRNKFDQARSAAQKLEYLVYEASIRLKQ